MGRFASQAMDDAHRIAAVRSVGLNPVAAGMVAQAQHSRRSSARGHVVG
jgi:putative transposase